MRFPKDYFSNLLSTQDKRAESNESKKREYFSTIITFLLNTTVEYRRQTAYPLLLYSETLIHRWYFLLNFIKNLSACWYLIHTFIHWIIQKKHPLWLPDNFHGFFDQDIIHYEMKVKRSTFYLIKEKTFQLDHILVNTHIFNHPDKVNNGE